MTKTIRAFALLCIALTVAVAPAQDQGGRRGGARQWQAGGMRGGQDGLRLLFRSDVQADLALTNEQKDKLDTLRQSGRREGGRRQEGQERPDREAMQARRAEQQKQLESILTPDQAKRLKEISIQMQGDMAIANPEVQKELAFTEAQKQKLTGLGEKYREAMQSVREKTRSGELDRQKARETMEANSKVLGVELRKILTAEQSKKFEALTGKPFKQDETIRR